MLRRNDFGRVRASRRTPAGSGGSRHPIRPEREHTKPVAPGKPISAAESLAARGPASSGDRVAIVRGAEPAAVSQLSFSQAMDEYFAYLEHEQHAAST